MRLEELLDCAPPELPVQVEVKAHGNPALARATAAEVCRVVRATTNRRHVEVLSFHACACEEAAADGLPARLIIWADYAIGALIDWAADAGVGGVCIEHFLLHPELVQQLRASGLSVSTGTINDPTLALQAALLEIDAITTDRPDALRRELIETAVGGVIGAEQRVTQPAALSTARIRGWPSISTSSITSTSFRPTTRPSRRKLSGVKPQ